MQFHGAFSEKKAAVAKERKTKHAFIRGTPTKHGYRYIVMSPRTNPIKRRNTSRRFKVGQSVTFHGYDGRDYSGRIAALHKRGVEVHYWASQLQREPFTTHLMTADANKRLTRNPYEGSAECKVCHALVAKSALHKGVCGQCREILSKKNPSELLVMGANPHQITARPGDTIKIEIV